MTQLYGAVHAGHVAGAPKVGTPAAADSTTSYGRVYRVRTSALDREKDATEERYRAAQQILENGLHAAHDDQHRRLQEKLRQRHRVRVQELTSGPTPLPAAEAEALATQEMGAALVKETHALNQNMQASKHLAQKALEEDYSAQIEELEHRHAVSFKGLESALKAKHKNEHSHLQDRLAKRRQQYAQKLVERGVAPQDAQALAAEA